MAHPRLIRARAAALAAAFGAALAASGCETISDNVDFEVLEPSQPEAPTPPARLVDAQLALIDSIESLEVGTTRNGVLLSAFGSAPRQGWFQPALRPLNDGLPGPDGFLDFEFVAAPPELNGGAALPVGAPAQRRVKAVRPIPRRTLSGAAGLRVFAAQGPPAALRFAPADPDAPDAERSRAAPPRSGPSGPSPPTIGG
ncbi:MAG: hypothetical protein AAF763_11400 [Pseudomonadota bacterium]